MRDRIFTILQIVIQYLYKKKKISEKDKLFFMNTAKYQNASLRWPIASTLSSKITNVCPKR